ncbi:hypothetical protein ON010_g16753 [Phytophthora cinnamomi]|nr:hypothetical protein ON010_g16753 [Phytophthora cinnamomi]
MASGFGEVGALGDSGARGGGPPHPEPRLGDPRQVPEDAGAAAFVLVSHCSALQWLPASLRVVGADAAAFVRVEQVPNKMQHVLLHGQPGDEGAVRRAAQLGAQPPRRGGRLRPGGSVPRDEGHHHRPIPDRPLSRPPGRPVGRPTQSRSSAAKGAASLYHRIMLQVATSLKRFVVSADERGHSSHWPHARVSIMVLFFTGNYRLGTDASVRRRSHIRTENGKWFVNPGSITGAFSSSASEVIPSFMLMALQGPKVVAFLYELKGDNVVVSKSEFTKET